jgi:ABC-2 type transport system ATP-binding protein
MAILEVRGLTKRYGDFLAVDDIDLSLEAGEIYGFLGPNGAGKTTTMRMLTGILPPTAGTIVFSPIDRTGKGKPPAIGVVPEKPSTGIFPWMTGWEYLNLFADMQGVKDFRKDALKHSERLGIASSLSTRYISFSRGMLQKLSIVRSLLHDPDILFLDEPVSSLDPLSAKEVLDLILDERLRGKAIFISSHILSDMERVCTRGAVICAGSIQAQGTIREIIENERLPSSIVLELNSVPAGAARLIESLDFVDSVREGGKTLTILLKSAGDYRKKVLEVILRAGCTPLSIRTEEPGLEDALLSLTAKAEKRGAGTERRGVCSPYPKADRITGCAEKSGSSALRSLASRKIADGFMDGAVPIAASLCGLSGFGILREFVRSVDSSGFFPERSPILSGIARLAENFFGVGTFARLSASGPFPMMLIASLLPFLLICSLLFLFKLSMEKKTGALEHFLYTKGLSPGNYFTRVLYAAEVFRFLFFSASFSLFLAFASFIASPVLNLAVKVDFFIALFSLFALGFWLSCLCIFIAALSDHPLPALLLFILSLSLAVLCSFFLALSSYREPGIFGMALRILAFAVSPPALFGRMLYLCLDGEYLVFSISWIWMILYGGFLFWSGCRIANEKGGCS